MHTFSHFHVFEIRIYLTARPFYNHFWPDGGHSRFFKSHMCGDKALCVSLKKHMKDFKEGVSVRIAVSKSARALFW